MSDNDECKNVSAVDLDAIEARARSPICLDCGDPKYKCSCSHHPPEGVTIIDLVRRLRDAFSGSMNR